MITQVNKKTNLSDFYEVHFKDYPTNSKVYGLLKFLPVHP